ncbi:flagellar hook-length control protein FliK [Solidesulfovibrio sp.]|uniref:flagellar hook-length control protein FliK n=1 Tax=Solidesulfovibrio sp. TaxID=2910990 RepID=UPI0026240CA7|nr:flagellar hook-length control protein FliK [Solidesulfovibrio sp.]
MQILPLVTARNASATENGGLDATLASRQSALFASLLDSARTTSGASQTVLNTTGSDLTATRAADATSARDDARTPGNDDLMNLRMTREDLAALRDDLKEQGFSDDELAAMDAKVGSESGMTWGEMMRTVEKKISKTDKSDKADSTSSTAKKEISNEDTVQLLGLFGKLGFTAEESQKMVDALAGGDTKSVLDAIDAKVAGLAADSKVSLNSNEMTTLGRAMNLSDEAQSKLAALFDQSSAASGLSGQGLTTAFNLVKNALLAQISQENKAMADFRQAASAVLDQAWLRESGKLNAGLHNDDVARKAAQAVAMGQETGGKTSETSTAAKPGLDVLADVPQEGQATGAQAVETAGQKSASEKSAANTLQNKAGAVAAEQATLAGHGEAAAQATTSEQGQTAGQTAGQVRPAGSEKAAAQSMQLSAENNASGQNAGQNAGQNPGQNAGQQGGGFFNQTGQDGALGELLSKIRVEKGAGQATGATGTTSGATTQTMAAMDAAGGQNVAKNAAKPFDAALAARAARQVETGILRNVGQDAKQLTLNLTPEDLGKVSVTITVKDKEVRAVISADQSDTAAMLNDQAAKIKQTLEDQGFKVTKLEVQTGIASDDKNAWQSPEQHNLAREQREQAERLRSSQRLARANGFDFEADADGFVPSSIADRPQGLDLFA